MNEKENTFLCLFPLIFFQLDAYSIFFWLQVIDFERDFQQLKLGEKTEKDIHYRNVLGFNKDLTGVVVPEVAPAQNSSGEEESGESRGRSIRCKKDEEKPDENN